MDRSTVAERKDGFEPFLPHPLVRGGDRQTILAALRPRRADLLTRREQAVLIDAGKDYTGFAPERAVRLLGFYTRGLTRGRRRGLVLLLHGWEGSSHSSYNLLLGSALIRQGYDVFRLNLRDHGPTHHLNPGFFYATLIEEAATAVDWVSQLAGEAPFYIVGASMGGNFALRLALWHGRQPFHNLRHVIAVNPALDPNHTSDALDRQPLYLHYFRRRWLASLRRKQALFPELYDFTPLTKLKTMREMTEWLVTRYGKFPDAWSYYESYSVAGDRLSRGLTVPTTIITAADDPIIPVEDFHALAPHPLLDVQIHPSGGHVGFTDAFPLRHCLPALVSRVLQRAGEASTEG